MASPEAPKDSFTDKEDLRFIPYSPDREEEYVAQIRNLIGNDLSEPYSIYVYRYFLYQWGDLCFMAMDTNDRLVGVVVSKLEPHLGGPMRGYIAMLAVQAAWRGRGIATKLVRLALDAMIARDAEEIVLEAETTNSAAMKLYERLGFLRSKRLHRYYLNGNTAYRFVLYVRATTHTLNRFPLGSEGVEQVAATETEAESESQARLTAVREPGTQQVEKGPKEVDERLQGKGTAAAEVLSAPQPPPQPAASQNQSPSQPATKAKKKNKKKGKGK